MFIVLFLLFCPLSSLSENVTTYYKNHDRLREKLFKNYNPKYPAVFPSGTIGETFEVRITMFYMKVIQVVEPQESLTTTFEYVKKWLDRRLVWDPADYGGIDQIWVSRMDLWIAETSIVDLVAITDIRPESEQYATVYANGTVKISSSVILSIICNLEVSLFPFDKQTCGINIYPFSYHSHDYKVRLSLDDGDIDYSTQGNGEWKLANISTSYTTFGDGMEMSSFNIFIERYSTYYVTMVVLPSFILNNISVFGIFLKDSDSASKLMIGLTNILSLIFIFGMISDSLPTTKYLPLLGYYILINLIIMVISVLLVLILPWMEEKGKKIVKGYRNSHSGLVRVLTEKMSVRGFMLFIVQMANLFNFLYFVWF